MLKVAADRNIENINLVGYNSVMKKIICIMLLSAAFLSVDASGFEINLHNQKEEAVNLYSEKESLARAMYAQNNLEETLNILYTIPEENRTAEVWLLLGNIRQDKGDLKSAVSMYENAIMTDKKNYKAYYNLGVLYFSEEKYSLALEKFKNAKKYKLDNPNIYYNLGCTYINLGEFRKAKNEIMYAIELKNNVPDYYYNMAYVYKKLGKDKKAQSYMDVFEKLNGFKE